MSLQISDKLLKSGFEIAEQSNAMLVYWDKDLVCRAANNAVMNWFGIDPVKMIDKITAQALMGPFFEGNLPYIKAVLEGKVQIFECDIPTASGHTRSSIVTYCPDFENGEVKGFYVHVADITFLKTKTSIEIINKSGGSESHLSDTEKKLNEVEKTLRACLTTEFPGISKLLRLHFISESKLKRDFKEKFNMGIFSYYRKLQMQLADKYISQQKCAKKEVASMLNFSNPSNFSACYQKYLEENNAKKLTEDIKKADDERYKTFIAQTPFAIAMFDNEMQYLLASQKWIDDYKLQNQKLLGASLYEKFPITTLAWKNIHTECLKGNINKGEDVFFENENDSPLWVKWDIRPWYNQQKEIGGLLIFIEDFTALKLTETENLKILEIVKKTNEIALTGAKKKNLTANTFFGNKKKEISGVADDSESGSEGCSTFYKEIPSHDLAQMVLRAAMEKSSPFDFDNWLS